MRSCQIQIDPAAAGELNILPDNVARRSGRGMDEFSRRETNGGVGALEFAAPMRKLDTIDPSYRE